MTIDMVNRLFYIVVWGGGIVAFWQITKHMPKALYTLLECISVMSVTVLCITPISMIIEYILSGNIHTTMMFVGCLASVGLLSGIWMVMVQSSRALQGKKQYQYVVL
jgi:ABC-type thiamin/hydroxymethylpyrimidine transport system permease subunit